MPTDPGRDGELTKLDNGALVFANVRGQGRRQLIFIGGLGDDHTLFEPLTAELAIEHRCLQFDNRGSGRSSRPDAPSAISDWADDAHHLAHKLGFAPAIAVGCSMGGAIAQEWALRHPRDLSALVLVSTWAQTDPYLRAVFSHWLELARSRSFARLAESMFLFSTSPQYLQIGPGPNTQPRAVPEPDVTGFSAQADACIAHDTLDRLEAIEVPTLVISGRHDILTRSEHSLQLTRAIRGARLETVATGHVPFWERPSEMARLVAAFVAEIPSATRA